MSNQGSRGDVAYLSLEAPREGVAGYAHVTEIIGGLRRRGWNIELYSLGYKWQRRSLIRRIFSLLFLQVKFLFDLRRFSILYIRAHPLAFPAAFIAKKFGLLVIHEVNGTWNDTFVAYKLFKIFQILIVYMQKKQYENADGLICVTPQLKTWLEGVVSPFLSPISIIPNGANISLFAPGASPIENLPESYVVFFGGLTAWHGVELMLNALQDDEWPKNLALVVAGDGPEMSLLQQYAPGDDRLVLLGRVSYDKIPSVVSSALAGLVPITDPLGRSATSGLAPIKLFETLSCGVPAIVTNLPFQAELVSDGNCGVVVPVDDPKSLARAVGFLARNPEIASAMGNRGRMLVVSKHSWDKRAEDTSEFMISLIDEKSKNY